jgi:hypothetical protein
LDNPPLCADFIASTIFQARSISFFSASKPLFQLSPVELFSIKGECYPWVIPYFSIKMDGLSHIFPERWMDPDVLFFHTLWL